MIKYILTLLFLTINCFGISKDQNPFALKINQETFLTDKSGVFIPTSILKLVPGNSIKIYLIDGTELNGLIKSTEFINSEIVKVFGELTNKNDAGFGFVLTKDAIFAGALVFRDKNIVYKINYSEAAKGFILIADKSEKIGS